MLRCERQCNTLVEIRDNLTARIAGAEIEGWLGGFEGLTTSRTAARRDSPNSTALPGDAVVAENAVRPAQAVSRSRDAPGLSPARSVPVTTR
jgi:hypothetical protein